MTVVHCALDSEAIENLFRADVGMISLAVPISLYLAVRFIRFWLDEGCRREIQLGLLFAGWVAWVAWELFMLSIARVATAAGFDASVVLSARWRILIPGVGIVLAIYTWWWLARSYWVAGLAVLIAASAMLWPEPLSVVALWVFSVLAK